MEEKHYPRQELRKVELSTVVPCAKCRRENRIGEEVFIDDSTGLVYHLACASVGGGAEDQTTKIHELTIEEGNIPIKSE